MRVTPPRERRPDCTSPRSRPDRPARRASQRRARGRVWRRAAAAVRDAPLSCLGSAIETQLNRSVAVHAPRSDEALDRPPPVPVTPVGARDGGCLEFCRHLWCVEEIADGLPINHALQQMKLPHEIPKPGVECRREARLRARKENLDWSTRVRLARPTWVVDGGRHFLPPCEVLAKAIGHALGD